jgi:hypothetical protein
MRGVLLGVAFNFGCHPATLDWRNLQYTEDWPYYAIQGIKETLGKDLWVAFTSRPRVTLIPVITGAFRHRLDIPTRTFAYAERRGRQMAAPSLACRASRRRRRWRRRPCQIPLGYPADHFTDSLPQAEQKAAAAGARCRTGGASPKRGGDRSQISGSGTV